MTARKPRIIYDNGLIVDADTGEVLGVEHVSPTGSFSIVNIVNALQIDRYCNSRIDRNINRARATVSMLVSKYYRKRVYHALACFEHLKSKIDFMKDHVTYRRSGVIVWVSREFAELLVDVFKCAGLPEHVLRELLMYLDTCR